MHIPGPAEQDVGLVYRVDVLRVRGAAERGGGVRLNWKPQNWFCIDIDSSRTHADG